MRENLNGELIIVTGASSGVGYAVARELVQQEGAIVVAVARRRVFRLEALARQIGQDKLFSVTADLSVPGEARRLAEQVKERWGTPSALVHAICRTLRAPALEVTDAELDLTMQVNVKSALYSVQAFAPLFREAQRGAVIIHNPTPHYTDEFTGSEAVSTAASCTLSAFTDGWARQLDTYRVAVREVNDLTEEERQWDNPDHTGHDVLLIEELKSALDDSDTAGNWAKYGCAEAPEDARIASAHTPLPVPEAPSALNATHPPLVLSMRGGLSLTEFA